MDGKFRPEASPLVLDIDCTNVLLNHRSDSESVESCGDILHCGEKDDVNMWTDEKHSLYIEHLEVSFVKQLHQSRGLLSQCSEENKRGKYVSQTRPMKSHNAFKQRGCHENINRRRSNILSGVSANSHNPVKGLRMHGPPMSADVPELICHKENHGKVPAEGSGQNFVEDDGQNYSNTNARAKRMKTAFVDSSNHY